MISVAEALAKVLDGVEPIRRTETIPLALAHGRTLAEDVPASRDQPPFAASAMDGYAVRSRDVMPDRPLRLIGESRAGHRFRGRLGPDEAVRIFTGAPLPDGADSILIQENARAERSRVVPAAAVEQGRYVRPRGLDFQRGDTLLRADDVLDAGCLVLAATANVADIRVLAKPRVALIATGDELVKLGSVPGPDQIVASSTIGVAAMLRSEGADVLDCGVAPDTAEGLNAALDRALAGGADLVVTLGGASVGDHDLVRPVFARRSVEWAFEKVAMRPGKPLMHGRDGERLYIGLPGNPVSSLVCTLVFVVPAIAALAGRSHALAWTDAKVGTDLTANDEREEFMRVSVVAGDDGFVATPFASQDSSLTGRFANADALLHRPAHAAPLNAGDRCRITFLRTVSRSPLQANENAG